MAMNIIKQDKFRSQGGGVNEDYDMYRVVIDIPIAEWRRFIGEWDKIMNPPDTGPHPDCFFHGGCGCNNIRLGVPPCGDDKNCSGCVEQGECEWVL